MKKKIDPIEKKDTNQHISPNRSKRNIHDTVTATTVFVVPWSIPHSGAGRTAAPSWIWSCAVPLAISPWGAGEQSAMDGTVERLSRLIKCWATWNMNSWKCYLLHIVQCKVNMMNRSFTGEDLSIYTRMQFLGEKIMNCQLWDSCDKLHRWAQAPSIAHRPARNFQVSWEIG